MASGIRLKRVSTMGSSQVFLVAFSITFGLSNVLSAQVESPPIPLELAEQNFALAERLAAADDGHLWGRSLNGPWLFVDPGSRFVVANQADANGQLVPTHNVWTGTLPGEVQIANTSLEWSGVRWTMVVWGALSGSVYDRGKLLMHESLHRIQPELGFPAESPTNAHLDSEEGRVWLRLEMRALAESMIRDGDEQREAIKHALIFRAMRHSKVGSSAAREEAALEFNEGICEYTGFKLCGLPSSAIFQRVAVDLEQRERGDNFSRSFAYGTGTAICLLLDVYDEDWRADANQHLDLSTRLATALSLDLSIGIEEQSQLLARLFLGHEVIAQEAARRIEREQRVTALKEKYITGKVLRIETGPNFRFSFNPNTAQTIDETRVVHTPFNAADEWGTIDAPDGAMIDFNSPMSLVLPIPDDATVENVPWKLSLAEEFRLDTSDKAGWRIVVGKD